MRTPSVTVIIATKNSGKTIRNCIDSVMKSKFKNFKAMVVDDCSSDNTWKILISLKKRYKSKLQIEQLESNIAKAHNHMIRKCDSEFIAFTDSDCIVDREWLNKLIGGFEKGVMATGGYCGTPTGVNRFQKLIGLELESRFRNFPEYMTRFPTMNLAVRSSLAKRNLFDESFDVAQESDWGFRVNRLGKMKYVPDAVVWHYHRAAWFSFFKQQYKYGRFAVRLYMKHKDFVKGDPISSGTMIIHPILFLTTFISIILGVFNPLFCYIATITTAVLLAIILRDSKKLSRNIVDFCYYLAIFATRLIAWVLGMLRGLFP